MSDNAPANPNPAPTAPSRTPLLVGGLLAVLLIALVGWLVSPASPLRTADKPNVTPTKVAINFTATPATSPTAPNDFPPQPSNTPQVGNTATPAPTRTPLPGAATFTPVLGQIDGPHVVGITAGVGQRSGDVAGLAPIAVSFSEAMNQPSAQAAFSLSPNVSGDFQWQQDTLIFTPKQALAASAVYTISVATSAKTAAGQALAVPAAARFNTAAPPKILRVLPSDGASEVPTNTIVTISFNRPMIPLTALQNQPDPAKWVTISPAIQGRWVWLGTAAVGFHADAPGFLPATSYLVTVKDGWSDDAGVAMAQGLSFAFSTIKPAITTVSPDNGSNAVMIDTGLSVRFNMPMERGSVQDAFRISSGVQGNFAWSDDSTTMYFTPTKLLDFDRSYSMSFSGTVKPAVGNATSLAGVENTWAFTTTDPTSIVNHSPDDNGNKTTPSNSFGFGFNNPLAPNQNWGSFLSISPNPDGYNGVLDIDANGTSVFTGGVQLRANTTYKFSLKAGLKDKWGFSVPAANWQVRIGPPPPALTLLGGNFQPLYSEAPSRLRVQVTSLDKFTLRLYQLSEADVRTNIQNPDYYYDRNRQAPGQLRRTWDVQTKNLTDTTTLYPIIALDTQADRLPVGYYIVQITANNPYDAANPLSRYATLSVGKVGLMSKREGQNILLWVADLGTGKPVANYPLRVEQLNSTKAIADVRGTTGSDGVLRLKLSALPDTRYTLVWTEQQGDAALLDTNWSNQLSPYELGGSSSYGSSSERAAIYVDRPIYRPNQTVYFRVVYRNDDDAAYTLPQAGKLLAVSAYIYTNQGQQVVYTGTVTLAATGNGNGEFVLPATAPVGDYTLRVISDANTNSYYGLASTSFAVQEYRKPDFQVNVTTGAGGVQGEPVTATVQTSYYFGGPLANVTTTLNLAISPYTFYWADPVSGESYTFGEGGYPFPYYAYDYEYGYGSYRPQPAATPITFQQRTDKNGMLQVDASGYVTTTDSSKSVLIEAQVQDLSNQAVANSSSTIVHQGLYYVGLKVGDYVATATQPTTITVRTITYDGKIQPNATVKLAFVRQDWQQPKYGQADQNWQQSEVAVGEASVTTDAQGRASYMFTPPSGGSYIVRGTSTDASGRRINSSLYFWATSNDPGYVPWRYQNDSAVSMVADKTQYRIGDTARILVTSPFTEATALLTVERGHIRRYQIITLKGGAPTIEVPLVDGDLPNVYVGLFILGPQRTPADAPADWGKQVRFRAGYVNLSLDTAAQQMKVTIAPQGQGPYLPGKTMTVTVNTRDSNNQPISGDFSLAVVDEAIYALGGENGAYLFASFWAERGTSISTSSSFSAAEAQGRAMERASSGLASSDSAAPAPTAAAKSDARDNNAQQAAPQKVRTDFRDTAFWRAEVTTDANGNADIAVPLPDNLTTWRLTAEGINTNTQAGSGSTPITATLPLLVRPVQPRFFTVGDKPRPQAIVQNNTSRTLDLTATLTVSGAITLDGSTPADQRISVAPGEQKIVTWNATVGSGDIASLRYWVHTANPPTGAEPSGGNEGYLEDAVANTLPVKPFAAPEAVATSGEVSGTRADEGLLLPYSINPQLGELIVQVSPSLAAATTDSINYVKEYPYESTDQTVSRFLPLVVLEQTYNEQGLKTPYAAQLPDLVARSVQRLQELQQPDGGWAWWEEGPASWWETAYAVQGLVAARDAGYLVPPDMLQRGIQRLQAFQQEGSLTSFDETYSLNMRAYSIYVLAYAVGQQGQDLSAEGSNLVVQSSRMSNHARAWLAMGLKKLGQDAQAKTVFDSLAAAARQSSTTAHWEEDRPDYWSMGTDNRATALGIDALVTFAPNDPLLPKAVRWIMSAAKEGHWLSSQETAITLVALAHYMAQSKELSADYNWQVSIFDQLLGSGNANSSTLTQTTTLRLPVNQMPINTLGDLALARDKTNGKMYYSVSLRYYVPGEGIKARSEGLAISRSYYRVADGESAPPTTQVNAGDLVRVRLTIVAPETSYYVMVTDPLPAGLEGVNGSLRTTSFTEQPTNPSGLRSDSSTENGYYWRWWGPFDNVEMRDDRTVLFATYLSPGTYVYEYFARATTPGDYMSLPANAELVYYPDVFGHSDGGSFTVK